MLTALQPVIAGALLQVSLVVQMQSSLAVQNPVWTAQHCCSLVAAVCCDECHCQHSVPLDRKVMSFLLGGTHAPITAPCGCGVLISHNVVAVRATPVVLSMRNQHRLASSFRRFVLVPMVAAGSHLSQGSCSLGATTAGPASKGVLLVLCSRRVCFSSVCGCLQLSQQGWGLGPLVVLYLKFVSAVSPANIAVGRFWTRSGFLHHVCSWEGFWVGEHAGGIWYMLCGLGMTSTTA
jgi:hypothetical protein